MRRFVTTIALIAACTTTRQHRHVVVERSSEGGKCVRECMTITATCEAAFTAPIGRDSRRRKCEGDRNECLLTCPGAREEVRLEQHASGRPGFDCDDRILVAPGTAETPGPDAGGVE